MRTEILTTIQTIVSQILGVQVFIGSMPPLNGYALDFEGGAPIETFRNLTTNEEMPIVFNGKNTDQQLLATNMNLVHRLLTTTKYLPFTSQWQIYAIETTSAPTLVGREENQNWVYGSSLRIKFFIKEDNNV